MVLLSALCSQVCGPGRQQELSWVSIIQMADCGTAQPSELCKPIPIRNLLLMCVYIDRYTYLSIYIYPTGSVSSENPEEFNSINKRLRC
jgi:hypothetical protein